MSKGHSSINSEMPSIESIRSTLGANSPPVSAANARYTPGTHNLQITDAANDTLITQVREATKSNNRIVITVTSNALIDSVKDLLDAAGLTGVSIYRTKSYLYRKHFGISYQYRDDAPPWKYSGTESEHDIIQRQKVEASKLWKLTVQHSVSDSLFRSGQRDEVEIVIMVNGVIFNPLRIFEAEDHNASLIMFKPGINDFQNYYQKVTYVDGVKKVEFRDRPDGFRLPALLDGLNVHYIVESTLVTDLIKTSYDQYRDGNLCVVSNTGRERDHNVRVLTSKLTSKKYSGIFPIVFNIMNKTSFEGRAVLVGDGMGSQHSFNSLRAGISMIDATTVVKLSQPPPAMIEALAMQLKHPDQCVKNAFQDIKKRIVVDYAESVLRRVAPDQDVYFVCDPKLPCWLRAEIPAFTDVETVRIDDDGGNFRRLRIDKVDNPIAYMLHKSIDEVVKLTKSKPALNQWIKNNDVVGQNLEKVIVGLMVTVTLAVREGFDGIEPVPSFKFSENGGDQMVLEDRGYVRLIELVDSSIKRYFREDVAYSSVYDRYRKSPYL